MKQIRFNPLRLAVATAIGAAFITGAASSAWADPTPAREEMRQMWTKHHQERVHARLARAANRLEIKASQQDAWQAFVKVVEQPVDFPAKKPDTPQDAAAMTRMHADFAAARAKKAAQVADATAKLQEVLTPEQRKTLDQIVRRVAQHGRHGMMHRSNWRGEQRGNMMGEHHGHGPGMQRQEQ